MHSRARGNGRHHAIQRVNDRSRRCGAVGRASSVVPAKRKRGDLERALAEKHRSVMRNLSFVLTSVFLACGGHVEHAAAPNPLGDSGVDETSLIDAAVAPARSCAKPRPGADRTCGAGRNDDCCATDVVVGGSFLRFYDHVAYATKDWPATVSSYSLGRYEVTVGRFRSFVESYVRPTNGAGAHPRIPGSGWQDGPIAADAAALRAALNDPAACDSGDPAFKTTWTDAAGANEHLPMTCVTWYEMFAFCAWDGGRLPTEAEWNYAASGGGDQRVYPWSKPPTMAIVDDTYAIFRVDPFATPVYVAPLPVGSRPKGKAKWGHHDLAGNVMEWVLDHSVADPPRACVDCAVVSSADDTRVLRGGSFASDTGYLRAARRHVRTPIRTPGVGARCARDVAR